ncbi:MAG TPA: FAD:protein FMN transferase [Gammaproteobacteria bacterium]
MICRRAICVLLALIVAGCAQEPRTERHAFFALGTLVEISVYDPPENIENILHAVEAQLLEQENRWRAWGDGELAKINERLAAGDAVSLDDAMLAGIERARDIAEQSGGRFNPAIGRMIEAWGFNSEEREAAPPPDDAELAAMLPPPTLFALEETGDGLWRTTDPCLWIDMGAFAKGLAVENAINTLRQHGIENAIVNAGGDLKVIGQHGERDWQIGVRDPRGDGVLAAIDASGNDSVFTSGDYERFFEWEGERYHHIIDPATARPARGVTSVTIIHADAALADAAATALFVAGPREWPATARALGIDKAMLVLANGDVEMTPMMRSRVEFVDSVPRVEILAP